MDLLPCVLLWALLPLPGALLWLRGRALWTAEDLCEAWALGTAGAFVLLYIGGLAPFAPVWAMAAAGALAWAFKSGRPRVELGEEGRLLAGLLLLALALRLGPAWVSQYPPGWDPYFHLILVKKILASGRLARDLAPYETIAVSYPQATHLAMAFVAKLTGAAPHRVFQAGMAWFGVLLSAQVFALFSRSTGRRDLGLYAAAAFAFVAVYGSLDYLRWGGFPNQAGMALYLGLLSVLLKSEPPTRGLPAFILLFVGLSLAHHHVMLMSGLTLGWMALWAAAFGPRTLARRIIAGLALSAAAGSPYFLSYLGRAKDLGQSRAFTYLEPLLTPAKIFADFGPPYFAAVALGLALWLWKRPQKAAPALAIQSLGVNIGLFVVLEYGWRWYSRAHWGREEAPFTPGRFLTNATCLLAVFPALLFAELGARLKLGKAAVAALLALLFLLNLRPYSRLLKPELSAERLEAYAWLREHADADAILIDRSFASSYLSGRASSDLPIPSSEPMGGASVRPIASYIKTHSAQVPPEAGKRQVLLVWDGDPRQVPADRTLWRNDGVAVVRLNPR